MSPASTARRVAGAAGALALVLALPATALAVTDDQLKNLDQAPDSGGVTGLDGGSATSGARVVVGLAIVVALVIVAHRVLRRLQRGRLGAVGAGDGVEVLSTTALSPSRVLHLVRVGDQVLLLGATDHGISTLHEVPHDDPIVAALLEQADGGAASGPAAQPRTLRVADALRDLTARG